jgi:4-amino-4-deoxy-L-arabinose transferase-like glycosyltransferase
MAIGAAVGLGLLTKYSIVFFIAGILAASCSVRARRFLKSPWFYASHRAGLPDLPAQLPLAGAHQFISYHFLQHIHFRDVGQGRADGFLADQFRI